MKFIKYSLLILLIAIASDALLVFAYPSPPYMSIIEQLQQNSISETDWRTKNTWTAQTYQNTDTFTWLTNPCLNCQICAKPEDIGGDMYVGVVTKQGQTKQFTDPTSISSPNDYKLKIWRVDTTLLTTYHYAKWTINA